MRSASQVAEDLDTQLREGEYYALEAIERAVEDVRDAEFKLTEQSQIIAQLERDLAERDAEILRVTEDNKALRAEVAVLHAIQDDRIRTSFADHLLDDAAEEHW